ncbi:hypothetical protein FHS18_002475 [Paenibacillus phyllosphaerae]|uniref:Uncharacterized protein n=1 Tax=Paenibacillus phyllosphaerae TaxID=274593 RepID=A0A7W5AX72_9BACL|nr:hypothetical protein [Paenibacillus phyllosphaerae]MBB3110408.1 hypothetical protein [Paenibacillus phyllosphaerae]
MAAKTTVGMNNEQGREVKRLFSAMNIMAWFCLAVGVIMCLINIGHFSDKNLTLMVGIGFLVGSVFIYTIGTAINMVENRKMEHEKRQ